MGLGDLLLDDGIGLLPAELDPLPSKADLSVFPSEANAVTWFDPEKTGDGAVLTAQLSKLPGIAHWTISSVVAASEARDDKLLLDEVRYPLDRDIVSS